MRFWFPSCALAVVDGVVVVVKIVVVVVVVVCVCVCVCVCFNECICTKTNAKILEYQMESDLGFTQLH